jgi:hypothetical protein
VRHKNGIASDDRAKNLQYGTGAQNTADRIAHGRTFRGERHPNARLSAKDVAAIRDSELPSKALAKKFHVHFGHINNIRQGLRWPTL